MVDTLLLLVEKLQNKEILSQKNHNGLTPLDLAAQEGHVGCVLLLLPRTTGGDNKASTEEDAKSYIEYYKTTCKTKTTTAPPWEAKKAEPGVQKTDATEDENQHKAAEITSFPDVSKDDIQKALELKKKGNAHFATNKWEQAHVFYSQVIAMNPKEATFYSNRSACCMSLR